MALLVGIAGTTWGLVRANQAAGAERIAREDAEAQQRLAEAERGKAEAAARDELRAREREAERAEGERKAKQEAEARKAEAERNLAFARKGNEILGSVFAGLDPKQIAESGRPLQDVLKDNLKQAVAELDGAAVGDPLEVTRMQHRLGLSLVGLGEYGPAAEVFRKALAASTARRGPDHPNTLTIRKDLAVAYLHAGQTGKAVPLLEEVVAKQKARLGPDHPETLFSLNGLASAYLELGERKGLPLFEESLEKMRAVLGPDNPDTLTCMNNLALAYLEVGQPGKAVPLLEAVVAKRKAGLGSDHPHTLSTMSILARAYQDSGQPAGALPLLEEVVAKMKAKLGPEHPETLVSMNNLAAYHWSVGRLDRSVPLFEEVLRLMERRFGRDHPQTIRTAGNLGVNYKDAGRLKDALPLLQQAYRASKTFPALSFVGLPLLDAYRQAGHSAAAADLIDELLADARKALPEGSPQLAGLLAQFGMTLLEMKEFAAAEPLLRECLAIREKAQPDSWATFDTSSMLGGAFLGQKKYADAEPLLVKGYEGMKAREKTIPPQGSTRIPEGLDRLIELYTATTKPDEVKKWRAERAKYPEVAPPPRAKK
jgi:tetratricopeptide (TPR) repeat protein